MPFCYRCGKELASDSRFCWACGASVTAPIYPLPRIPVMPIISEASVHVRPIIVARANPMTLEDLSRTYRSKREHIQQRLNELRAGWGKTDEGVFAELCYGILLAGRSAEATLPVVVGLEKNKLLFQGSERQIEQYMEEQGYAFKERSKYLVNWRYRFNDRGSLVIKSLLERKFRTPKGWNIFRMREYLASQHDGVGWKVASQFLRNVGVGLGYGLALLDRHIQRELEKFGYIPEVVPAPNKRRYLEYERRMQDLARDSGIPMDDLDLLIWSNKTGKIMK